MSSIWATVTWRHLMRLPWRKTDSRKAGEPRTAAAAGTSPVERAPTPAEEKEDEFGFDDDDLDAFDKLGEALEAEARKAAKATPASHHYDAPRVVLRNDEGRYESPEKLREKGLALEGRAVLIATPNARGYVDPPTLKWMIDEGSAKIGHDYINDVFTDAKLPPRLLNQRHVDAPTTLVAIDGHTLASGAEAKKLQADPSQPLHQAYIQSSKRLRAASICF